MWRVGSIDPVDLTEHAETSKHMTHYKLNFFSVGGLDYSADHFGLFILVVGSTRTLTDMGLWFVLLGR